MGWGGRQEGGSGWGTHVHPWLIHINVWQKPLQYCKVISVQLIKIKEKKKTIQEKFERKNNTRRLTLPDGKDAAINQHSTRVERKISETIQSPGIHQIFNKRWEYKIKDNDFNEWHWNN